MPVTELNHYFVRANDLERSRRFYIEVLGFEEMPRPNFPFPGYWLGVGGKTQVHMGAHGIANAELYYLGTTPRSDTDNAGVVDHIAFLATDPRAFSERFDAIGLKARKRYLPEFQLFQMFVKDPDGLTIELNFHGIQDDSSWAADGENYADMPRLSEVAWTADTPAAGSPSAVSVSYDELQSAFDWVNAGGGMFGNSAYVSRATGAVHWASDSMDTEDELPADIDDGTIYVALPHKNDLDLGKRLALRFADEALPESSHLVASYFHKRGAYARFKDLLERKGQLQAWHHYEARAVEAALRAWCREQGLQLKP